MHGAVQARELRGTEAPFVHTTDAIPIACC